MKRFSVVAAGILLAGLLLPAACSPRVGTYPCPTVPGEQVVSRYIDSQGRTGISGLVLLKESGQPLAEAYVNIYPDTTSNLLGPSQFISLPTDPQGHYLVEVPPGTYYVVARKRMSGQMTGPLSPGDYYSEHQRIVTQVVEGRLAVVDLEVVSMKAPMFFKKEVVERVTDTGIRGVLLDEAGKPFAGGFAMAYVDRQMQRLPDYASTLSDAEGHFTLFLPQGGTYYLAGRIHAWDMPRPGEPYGVLGGEEDPQPVRVRTGNFVEGVTIRLVPFAGEYKKGKSRRPF